MSTLRSLLVVLSSLFLVVTQATAQEVVVDVGLNLQPSLEIGFVSGGATTSGNPVNVGMSAAGGVGVRAIIPMPWEHTELALGIAYGKYGQVDMGGRSLGNGPSSTTLSATGRYRFEKDDWPTLYVGGGFYQTSFDSTTVSNGTVKLDSADLSGLVAEAGLRTKPFWRELYADVNVRKYFGSVNARLATSAGNALLTNVSRGAGTEVMFSLGWKF